MKQENHAPSLVERLSKYSYYVFVLGYLVTLAAFSWLEGSLWTTSTIVFLISAALLGAVGLDKPWTRPWLALVIIGLSFQIISGPIDALGDTGGVFSFLDLDKYAWGFNLTGWTQSTFSSGPLTEATSLVYASLLPFVFVTSIAVWRYRRRSFARFATAMVLTSYGALITFVLMPTAPPWFSGAASNLFTGSGGDAVAGVFAPFSALVVPDYFASFPSLHAAYTITCCYFLYKVDHRLGLLGGLVAGATLFSTLYLGQHYAIDLVGGAVYSLVPCWASGRWGPREVGSPARAA